MHARFSPLHICCTTTPEPRLSSGCANVAVLDGGGIRMCQEPPTADASKLFEVAASDWNGSGNWNAKTGQVVTKGGSPTKTTKAGTQCVNIDQDGEYFGYNINIGPRALPVMTMEATVYVNSKANNRGWLMGAEDTAGCPSR